MVAYSFQRRFVAPICTGLGREIPRGFFETMQTDHTPKRQTIRKDRKRHARPGELMQLYHGMRTRQCFLIGEARCISANEIRINFNMHPVIDVLTSQGWERYAGDNLDAFARRDGFSNWNDMSAFWREQHPKMFSEFIAPVDNPHHGRFGGVIICWEALT
jgi:hypothetical protein